MASTRLEQHYLRLLDRYGTEPLQITLQQLADAQCCTRRHMRSILRQMDERGWIHWASVTGRGHLSTLQLLRSELIFLRDQARQLIDAGDVGAAVHLLEHHQDQLVEVMSSQLGHVVRQQRQILRVPYYRTIRSLYPRQWLRRTEVHLIRQVFNGLTKIDENLGTLAGDIAHAWRSDDACHWIFYLRPAIYGHDGNVLQMKDVIDSLESIKKFPLFSHIAHVNMLSDHELGIELNQPDPRFPWLLAEPMAVILPSRCNQSELFSRTPVGTGPYAIREQTQWHLSLQAFDHYFGYRALLDEIDILILPDAKPESGLDEKSEVKETKNVEVQNPGSAIRIGMNATQSDGKSVDQVSSALEQGCYFLVFSPESPWFASPEQSDYWREYLCELLDPSLILAGFPAGKRDFWVPAHSLLPAWFHHRHQSENGELSLRKAADTKTPDVLTLAYYEDHPEYALVARVIQDLLRQSGLELQLLVLSYQDWVQGRSPQHQRVDIWLGSINFSVPTYHSIGAWIFGWPLLRDRLWSTPAEREQALRDWREQSIDEETLVRQVIQQGWLCPLFHHWLQIRGPLQLKNLRLNQLGWFDFKTVWLAP